MPNPRNQRQERRQKHLAERQARREERRAHRDKRHLSRQTRHKLRQSQRNEITEHHIYKRLAQDTKNAANQKVLEQIANEERDHYEFWKNYTQEEVKPDQFKISLYYLISKIFGLTFGVKLMEKGEEDAQKTYEQIAHELPESKHIIEEEEAHEKKILEMINEELLAYVGSVVLGLNDALVELTGALAGMTFAFANSSLIATAGLITGVAASFSMAASEYLSTKSEAESKQDPKRAAIYTGLAYIATVILLIIPFLILKNVFIALAISLSNALVIIFLFNFYVSVAQDVSFKKRFLEMVSLSFGVSLISFAFGYLIRTFFNIEI